jgi:LysR family transcriptional regulator, glycine cleavage system transcriptional activator
MTFRLPPLNTLRIFEAAGRLSSFRLASDELNLTPSAVSHGVRTLEEWLGTALFVRRDRGVTITAAGEAYLPRISGALNRLAVAVEQTRGTRNTGRLSVSVAPTFAARWLLSRLPRFFAQYPEIIVSIDTEVRQIDIPADGPDLAIRMAAEPRGRGTWVHLMRQTAVPVCSPLLLSSLPEGLPDQLEAGPLLHVTAVSEDWKEWFAARGLKAPSRAPQLQFDTIHLALLVDDDLRSGRLKALDEARVTGRTSYWLVGAENALERPEALYFRKWIVAELAAGAASQACG